jgi:hypothetical protein
MMRARRVNMGSIWVGGTTHPASGTLELLPSPWCHELLCHVAVYASASLTSWNGLFGHSQPDWWVVITPILFFFYERTVADAHKYAHILSPIITPMVWSHIHYSTHFLGINT